MPKGICIISLISASASASLRHHSDVFGQRPPSCGSPFGILHSGSGSKLRAADTGRGESSDTFRGHELAISADSDGGCAGDASGKGSDSTPASEAAADATVGVVAGMSPLAPGQGTGSQVGLRRTAVTLENKLKRLEAWLSGKSRRAIVLRVLRWRSEKLLQL